MMIGAPWGSKGIAEQLTWILGYQAVLGVTTSVLCLVTFVDEPPEPPGLEVHERKKRNLTLTLTLTSTLTSILTLTLTLTLIPG